MIRISISLMLASMCWPRTSGDDPFGEDAIIDYKGLAPHERG